MKLMHFPEQNATLAKSQPPYIPMPVHVAGGTEGRIVCCWKLSFAERLRLLLHGRIWHQILTFNHPLQPQLLTVDKPRNMTWNLPQSPPTLTPAPESFAPDASTSSDVDAPSPTISEKALSSNSVESGG